MNVIRLAKSLAAGVVIMGASPSANALDLIFDGFCNGLSITTNADGFTSGNEAGCASGPTYGTKGRVDSKKKTKAHTLYFEGELSRRFLLQLNLDNTYTLFDQDGSEVLSGSWSEVTPEAAATKRFGGGKSFMQ